MPHAAIIRCVPRGGAATTQELIPAYTDTTPTYIQAELKDPAPHVHADSAFSKERYRPDANNLRKAAATFESERKNQSQKKLDLTLKDQGYVKPDGLADLRLQIKVLGAFCFAMTIALIAMAIAIMRELRAELRKFEARLDSL
ncbi:hypothetical protein DFH09DRAFT_1314474 [Mycena vulgaris]|nr:hypothetical protein DFH09DRAFT_1314474 [Mycena vulgaris]